MKTSNYSKTTKRNTDHIRSIINDLRIVTAYINKKDVAIGRLSETATTTAHYTCERYKDTPQAAFYPITKWIGSELCYLLNAIEKLEKFEEATKA